MAQSKNDVSIAEAVRVPAAVARAWAKVSMVTHWRAKGITGVHMGYLHADPRCHYLKSRKFDVAQSRVVEVTGELLDVVEWCSKCAPERIVSKVNVEFSVQPCVSSGCSKAPIEQPRRVFMLPAATEQNG